MKKILSLLLCAILISSVMFNVVGCGSPDPNDKGATITMYLASDPSNINLDPAKMIYSSEAVKFMGLIFEGLMKTDENGKIVKAIAEKYTIEEDIDEHHPEYNTYKMYIDLKHSRWSDGIVVSADDFVYAWKRILEPEFASPAAPLLYDIKNARAVKNGDMTIDDLGVAALDEKLLEITFERKPDYEKFVENLASIALVPVRADTVDPDPEGWAKKTLTLITNGPFTVKQMEYNKVTMLERSTYYMLEGKKDENIKKFVEPYRIILDYSRNLEQMEQAYASNDLVFYLGNVPVEKYSTYEKDAVLTDMLSAYSYHFNATVAPFDKPEVRQALSIALDRNQIASIVSLGVKPATGIVPTGIIDKDYKSDFRKEGGDLISPSGDVSQAKSLLQGAGVSGGSYTLKISADPNEKKIAEYAVGVWKELGFNFDIQEVRGVAYGETILSGDYQVMGYTDQAIGIDAYSVLAPFAKPFSGETISFLNDDETLVKPHITGFQDDTYDALMEEILIAETNDIRTQKLHAAESMLVQLSPVAPLYFHTGINITKDISGLSYSKFGYTIFSKAKLKDYKQYETETEEVRETVVAEG